MKLTPDKKVQYLLLGTKWPKKQATSPTASETLAKKKNGDALSTASETQNEAHKEISDLLSEQDEIQSVSWLANAANDNIYCAL